MIACLLLLSFQSPDFDAIAQKRDVAALRAIATPEVLAQPRVFDFLTKPGAYGVGRFGWRAKSAVDPVDQRRYVVFTTRLTSEDVGEAVFEVEGGKLVRAFPELETLGVRIVHHDFDLRFEPAAKTLIARDKVTLRLDPVREKSFQARFSPCYKVSKVVDGAGREVKFSQAGGVVFLPTPAGSRATYELSYTGVVDQPEYAGAITSGEVMLTNDYWYPMIGRQAATQTVTATIPAGWTLVAQGTQTFEKSSGATKTASYRMDLPTVYFSLSAGPYESRSDTIGGRRFVTWGGGLNQEQMRAQNEANAHVIDFYSKAFGAYPFPQWGSMITPLYGGGALEAYSFATYGTGWLPAIDGHEPAHTWWGGIIPNSYLKSFWNESFAVYSAGLYEREADLGNRTERRLAFVSDATPSNGYRAASLLDSGASWGPPASELGYGKGGKVLQMLESEIGVDAMIRSLAEWVKVHPRGELGEWEGFLQVVRRVSGANLDKFIEEWFRRPGWADFSIEDVTWSTGKLRASAKFAGSPYSLKCEFMLQFPDGRKDFGSVRFEPDRQGNAKILIDCRQKPALVSFDPWRKLLRRTESNEAPAELRGLLRRFKRYNDPKRPGWMPFGPQGTSEAPPSDLTNAFLIGSPETMPAMKSLCDKVGFQVSGNKLTYKGTTIDLNAGAAMALVDLGGGKMCAIGLGATRLSPETGRARLCVVDDLGRVLRAETEPKTSGFLTARL